MRFFELHFNPQRGQAPDLVFDTFCYEPESIYERKLGYLFAAGLLKNVLWQNVKLLDNLSGELKKSYYSGPLRSSSETALKESLKKANEFLESLAKQGEVSWLGNLNFAAFSLAAEKRDVFDINFAKVGEIKVLLLRPGKITDIGKNLEYSEIEPYPLKIFSNIVSGRLEINDVVAVLTKEVFELFAEKNMLAEIARITPNGDFGAKLKEILKKRDKELSKLSGVCLICVLTKEVWPESKKAPSSLIFQKPAEKFSLARVLKQTLEPAFSSPFAALEQKIRSLKKAINQFSVSLLLKKNVILLLLLLLLLILGFFLF